MPRLCLLISVIGVNWNMTRCCSCYLTNIDFFFPETENMVLDTISQPQCRFMDLIDGTQIDAAAVYLIPPSMQMCLGEWSVLVVACVQSRSWLQASHCTGSSLQIPVILFLFFKFCLSCIRYVLCYLPWNDNCDRAKQWSCGWNHFQAKAKKL